MSGKTISAIIPVYNEEETVANVLSRLLSFKTVCEIVCVNDGSTDKSLEILKGFGDKIKLVNLSKNHGKGAAMAVGAKTSKGEIIVFLDADLIDLTEDHIKSLTEPLISGKSRVVVGCLSGALAELSGQRAFWRKDILPRLKALAKTRYGAEVFLNEIFKKRKTKVVNLEDLTYLKSSQKNSHKEDSKLNFTRTFEVAKVLLKIQKYKLQKFNRILLQGEDKSVKELAKTLDKLKDKKIVKILKQYLEYLGEYLNN